MTSSMEHTLAARLRFLYGEKAAELVPRLLARIAEFPRDELPRPAASWDQQDVVLITYGDMVQRAELSPLAALRTFFLEEGWEELFNTVHLLPFYPWSSDDGFSVVDYEQVDPRLGTWQDVDALGKVFHLMFDLVLNHLSQRSEWFQRFLRGESPWDRCFIEVDPAADLTQVVRPRSLPLLTSFETSRGTKHVWTTFSPDQIDLNYAEPELLLKMIDVLLLYARHGARIVRLDAIAYLWKQLGTACVHLPQTHTVVKLLREVLQATSPGTWLLTETNVPHAENISYFGAGDEAQLVYQFSLPPLLLDAMLSSDARVLRGWLADLSPPPPGTTYFNFTASHDGIGVRPLEGLVPPERFDALVDWTKACGGGVSTRRRPDGTDAPYELNVTYVDALSRLDDPARGLPPGTSFLATQAVMLALRGIPGVYFHSLVGTSNDHAAVLQSGQPRRINRRKFEWSELQASLAQPGSLPAAIYRGYRRLLTLRRRRNAFHPDAEQRVVDSGDSRILAFLRSAPDGASCVLVALNVGRDPVELPLRPQGHFRWTSELIRGTPVGECLTIGPQQTVWVEGRCETSSDA